MIKMYGIKNCTSVQKARNWLEEKGVEYEFHDYKKEPATEEFIVSLADELGWENTFKRRGMLWNKMSAEDKENLNRENAIARMIENNSTINRPITVLENGEKLVSWKEDLYEEKLG